jgi:transposase
VDTKEGVAVAGRRRRRHSEEFKAQVVMASRQPGVSMAAVAMAHGINANLLRRWVCQRAALPQEVVTANASSDASRSAFIPLALAAPVADVPLQEIRIELQRGATAVKVNWPTSAAGECAVWLRELLR